MTTTVITHIRNEEYLLPWWLQHHVPMFDHGVVIDYASSDRSVEIVRAYAPHWEVRQSRNSTFDAVACDAEVMDIERSIEGWKIALTATEFFHCPSFPDWVNDLTCDIARIRPVAMVDKEENHPDHGHALTDFCHTGFFGGYMEPYKGRYIHRHPTGEYLTGRHDSHYSVVHRYPEGALVLWYGFAPWTPELRARKLQIQNSIPDTDRKKGYGVQHMIDEPLLYGKWHELSEISHDLRAVPEYASVVI